MLSQSWAELSAAAHWSRNPEQKSLSEIKLPRTVLKLASGQKIRMSFAMCQSKNASQEIYEKFRR